MKRRTSNNNDRQTDRAGPALRETSEKLKCAATENYEPTPRAWVVEVVRDHDGKLRATKICSAPLETHLWLLHDAQFCPPDDDPIFFEDEIPALRTKSVDELRRIIRIKRVFPPGSRVRR